MPVLHIVNPSLFDLASPQLHAAMVSRDTLVVLTSGCQPLTVVLGVPHQARAGEDFIAEVSLTGRRPSDDGAAFFALETFRILITLGYSCKLVVMAHDTSCDPNKDDTSAYWQAVFDESELFRLLLECHGASPKRAVDLEVSAGKNHLGDALRFGRMLAQALDYCYTLAAEATHGHAAAMGLTRLGEIPTHLKLPALQTNSLIYAAEKGVPALHIEAKPCFRNPPEGGDGLSPDGAVLAQALAETVIQYLET